MAGGCERVTRSPVTSSPALPETLATAPRCAVEARPRLSRGTIRRPPEGPGPVPRRPGGRPRPQPWLPRRSPGGARRASRALGGSGGRRRSRTARWCYPRRAPAKRLHARGVKLCGILLWTLGAARCGERGPSSANRPCRRRQPCELTHRRCAARRGRLRSAVTARLTGAGAAARRSARPAAPVRVREHV